MKSLTDVEGFDPVTNKPTENARWPDQVTLTHINCKVALHLRGST